jgi:hypothetical protein
VKLTDPLPMARLKTRMPSTMFTSSATWLACASKARVSWPTRNTCARVKNLTHVRVQEDTCESGGGSDACESEGAGGSDECESDSAGGRVCVTSLATYRSQNKSTNSIPSHLVT